MLVLQDASTDARSYLCKSINKLYLVHFWYAYLCEENTYPRQAIYFHSDLNTSLIKYTSLNLQGYFVGTSDGRATVYSDTSQRKSRGFRRDDEY